MPERAASVDEHQTAASRVARTPEPAARTEVSAPAWASPAGARVPSASGAPGNVPALQRLVGNQAVMRMLDAQRPGHPVTGPTTAVQALRENDPDAHETVQRAADDLREPSDEAVRSAATEGVRTPSTTLPYLDRIQASFGRHSVAHVQAHVGPEAARASRAMNALAYASGTHVVFGATPDLRTAAHEAAHIVQQQAGVQLSGGIGREGDPYERHADTVADAVVAGRSAEGLLGPSAHPFASGERVVQGRQGNATADDCDSFALHCSPIHVPTIQRLMFKASNGPKKLNVHTIRIVEALHSLFLKESQRDYPLPITNLESNKGYSLLQQMHPRGLPREGSDLGKLWALTMEFRKSPIGLARVDFSDFDPEYSNQIGSNLNKNVTNNMNRALLDVMVRPPNDLPRDLVGGDKSLAYHKLPEIFENIVNKTARRTGQTIEASDVAEGMLELLAGDMPDGFDEESIALMNYVNALVTVAESVRDIGMFAFGPMILYHIAHKVLTPEEAFGRKPSTSPPAKNPTTSDILEAAGRFPAAFQGSKARLEQLEGLTVEGKLFDENVPNSMDKLIRKNMRWMVGKFLLQGLNDYVQTDIPEGDLTEAAVIDFALQQVQERLISQTFPKRGQIRQKLRSRDVVSGVHGLLSIATPLARKGSVDELIASTSDILGEREILKTGTEIAQAGVVGGRRVKLAWTEEFSAAEAGIPDVKTAEELTEAALKATKDVFSVGRRRLFATTGRKKIKPSTNIEEEN